MHLSPHVPEETAYVAQTMADNGATDEYIGLALMYHYHDLGNATGCSVQVVRDGDTMNGVVVQQPSGPNYPPGLDEGEVKEVPFGAPQDAPSILPAEEQ